jgi:branched-chain amino acid transport system substrate-binding protein
MVTERTTFLMKSFMIQIFYKLKINRGMKNSGKIIMGIAIIIMGIAIISGCHGNHKTRVTETIKIGVVVPLTGNAGILGDYTLKGLQYAVDEQNSKGGLLSRKIELDIRDSKADPKEGVNLINKMMEQKNKPFMVYSIVSGVTQAIKPVTEANNIILMSAVGTDKFLEESKYTVQNYISAATIGKEISQFLRDTMKVSSVTIFYSDNEYGKSMKDAVVKNCIEKKINVITEPFDETSLDYLSLIAAKINKDTECVYAVGVGAGLGIMFRQIKESGYCGKIIGDPLMAYPDVEKAAGSALKGITYLDLAFNSKSKDTTIQAFVNGFENKFKISPQNYSIITYDGVKLLFSLIEKAGTINSDVLIKELNNVRDYQGVFGPVSVTDRNINYRFIFKTWN